MGKVWEKLWKIGKRVWEKECKIGGGKMAAKSVGKSCGKGGKIRGKGGGGIMNTDFFYRIYHSININMSTPMDMKILKIQEGSQITKSQPMLRLFQPV